MSNYHFEDEENKFGATIDISKLQKELAEEEKRRASGPDREPQKPSKKFLIATLLLGVLVFILMLLLVWERFSPGKDEGNAPAPITAAVIRELDGRTMTVKNLEDGSIRKLEYTAGLLPTTEGAYVPMAEDLFCGQLIEYGFNEITGHLESLSPAAGSWQTEPRAGLQFDPERAVQSITLGSAVYSCSSSVPVFWQDIPLTLSELSAEDELILRGMGDEILSIEITAFHGNLVFQNVSSGITLTIDGQEFISLNESSSVVPISAGGHDLKFSGTGIEDYSLSVYISEGERYVFDLASLQGKMALLVLNVNTSGYQVYVDDELYPGNENPLVVPVGEHTLRLTHDSFEDWNQSLTLSEGVSTVDVEMVPVKKSSIVVIRSTPTGADVFLNGEYLGVTPIMQTLPYDTYDITLQKARYKQVSVTIAVSNPEEVVTVELKEAQSR